MSGAEPVLSSLRSTQRRLEKQIDLPVNLSSQKIRGKEDVRLQQKISTRLVELEKDGTDIIKDIGKLKTHVADILEDARFIVDDLKSMENPRKGYQDISQRLVEVEDDIAMLAACIAQWQSSSTASSEFNETIINGDSCQFLATEPAPDPDRLSVIEGIGQDGDNNLLDEHNNVSNENNKEEISANNKLKEIGIDGKMDQEKRNTEFNKTTGNGSSQVSQSAIKSSAFSNDFVSSVEKQSSSVMKASTSSPLAVLSLNNQSEVVVDNMNEPSSLYGINLIEGKQEQCVTKKTDIDNPAPLDNSNAGSLKSVPRSSFNKSRLNTDIENVGKEPTLNIQVETETSGLDQHLINSASLNPVLTDQQCLVDSNLRSADEFEKPVFAAEKYYIDGEHFQDVTKILNNDRTNQGIDIVCPENAGPTEKIFYSSVEESERNADNESEYMYMLKDWPIVQKPIFDEQKTREEIIHFNNELENLAREKVSLPLDGIEEQRNFARDSDGSNLNRERSKDFQLTKNDLASQENDVKYGTDVNESRNMAKLKTVDDLNGESISERHRRIKLEKIGKKLSSLEVGHVGPLSFMEGCPSMFWIYKESKGLSALQDYLETRYGLGEGDGGGEGLTTGSPVLAKYSQDGRYFRANVEEVMMQKEDPADCLYSVCYMDYGNSEVVSGRELISWDRKLEAVPQQAVSCCLADGPRIWREEGWGAWTGEQINVFHQTIREGEIIVELQTNIKKENDPRSPMFTAFVWINGVNVVEILKKHPLFSQNLADCEPKKSYKKNSHGGTPLQQFDSGLRLAKDKPVDQLQDLRPNTEIPVSPVDIELVRKANVKVNDWLNNKCEDAAISPMQLSSAIKYINPSNQPSPNRSELNSPADAPSQQLSSPASEGSQPHRSETKSPVASVFQFPPPPAYEGKHASTQPKPHRSKIKSPVVSISQSSPTHEINGGSNQSGLHHSVRNLPVTSQLGSSPANEGSLTSKLPKHNFETSSKLPKHHNFETNFPELSSSPAHEGNLTSKHSKPHYCEAFPEGNLTSKLPKPHNFETNFPELSSSLAHEGNHTSKQPKPHYFETYPEGNLTSKLPKPHNFETDFPELSSSPAHEGNRTSKQPKPHYFKTFPEFPSSPAHEGNPVFNQSRPHCSKTKSLADIASDLVHQSSLASKQTRPPSVHPVTTSHNVSTLQILVSDNACFNLTMSKIDNPGQFFVRPVQDETECLGDISEEVQCHHLAEPEERLVVPGTVWAIMDETKKWFRVRIEKRDITGVSIRYIDYGGIQHNVAVNCLRELPATWVSQLPGLAVPCHLAGCQPKGGKWDVTATTLLQEFVGYESQHKAILVGEGEGDVAGSLGIVLLAEGVVINEKMVEWGFAESQCMDYFQQINDIIMDSEENMDYEENKYLESWNPMEDDYFGSLENNYKTNREDVEMTTNGYKSKDVVCPNFEIRQESFRGQLCENPHMYTTRPAVTHDREEIAVETFSRLSLPCPGRTVYVEVCEVISPSLFYCVLALGTTDIKNVSKRNVEERVRRKVEAGQETLASFMKHMQMFYKDKTRTDFTAAPALGELVACQNSGNNLWYRGRITADREAEVKDYYKNNEEEGKSAVFFVDYGQTELVELSQMRRLETRFTKFPMQAVECCLAGVIPMEEAWSEEVTQKFKTMVQKQWLMAQVVSCEDGRIFIDLLIPGDPGNDVNVAEELRCMGLARMSKFMSANTPGNPIVKMPG